ncbi:MAG: Dot/Icm secretion system protein IcmQ [Gammaproteobacteria bacterium]|nr:Dot/Icm secretion system protein IcmQ [Gammaproteobacteria bacterium]
MSTTGKLTLEEVQKVQDIMNQLLAEKDWEQATYLKILREELQKIYTTFNELAGQVYSQVSEEAQAQAQLLNFDKTDYKLVYISVYSSEGVNLDAWQRIIINLPKQFITRAIYENEYDVQDAIKMAPIFANAAYVAIWVEKNLILSSEDFPPQFDKLGNQLINLRDRAVQLNKIDFFWNNMSKYRWINDGFDFIETIKDMLIREQKNN